MAVRTRRLAEQIITTTGASGSTSLFTVPTDRTAIVKEIVLSQTAGSLSGLYWFYVDTAGADTLQVAYFGLTANDLPERREMWLVMHEGDQLVLAQSSSRTCNVYVSGSLLAGDPS